MPKQKLSCFDTALHILSQRSYAVKEMAGKLKTKQFEGYEIAKTIDRLLKANFLNDEDFAQSRTRYRAEVSKWGKNKIHQELIQKGVAENLVTKALENLENPKETYWEKPHDFKETAVALINRRFGAWENAVEPSKPRANFKEQQTYLKQVNKEKKRRIDFLLRRGFSLEEALNAFEKNKAGLIE